MKFKKFVKLYKKQPVIDSKTFPLYTEKPQDLRRQVNGWLKKGYLRKLKKGLYVFSEEWKSKTSSPLFVANYLVSPSYISLQYAMGYYGLIPEKVTVYTSVSTKKTNTFENAFGRFQYSSIKKGLFFGFIKETEKGQDYFIALPEKALLDFFYFNSDYQGKFDEFESLRLQNLDKLNKEKIFKYSSKFTKRVKYIGNELVDYCEIQEKKYK